MEMEIEQPQVFFDFNEGEGFNFDFDADYNAAADPLANKQASSAAPADDGTFDSPSASPLPLIPEPLSFTTLPLELSSHSDDVLFDDPILTDAVPAIPDAVAEFDNSSVKSSPQDSSYAESRESDSEGQNKRGRKRKAPATPPAIANERKKKMKIEPGRVIPKDELHTLSAEELEEYAQHIQDSNIPAVEKNEIRKQLRLVKNRESAQASRLRKKNYIDDLERRVSMLQSENSNLRQNVTNLHNENTQLKSEVVYLKGVVNNGGLSKVLSQGASFFSKLSQQQQQQPAGSKTGIPSINPRTAGVVLMVVLFSVGMMFNSQMSAPLPGKVVLGESKPGRVLNHANYKPASEVRDVLTVLEQSEMPTQRIRNIVEKQRIMPDSSSHKVLEDRPAKQAPSVPEAKSAVTSDAAPLALPEWKANTTYLFCPEVRKLNPPSDVEVTASDLPQQISFLVPQSAFGAGDDATGAQRSTSQMLEVTCQVLDVAARAVNVKELSAV